MASGEPLAGVKQTLKEKRTSETTALDFVPSWVGQLHDLRRPTAKGRALDQWRVVEVLEFWI
jgi:hypothetical protein